MFTFDTPITQWPLIRYRTRLLKALENIEIFTVKNLLFHFPSRYEDLSRVYTLSEALEFSRLPINEKITVQGTLASLKQWRTPKKRIMITEGILEDASGKIKVMWFNQPFLIRTLKRGMLLNLSGKVIYPVKGPRLWRDSPDTVSGLTSNGARGKEPTLQNPSYELVKPGKITVHTGRLIPIYPETKGVTSRWLRFLIAKAFPLIKEFSDALPKDLLAKLNLPSTKTGLSWLHFPENDEQIRKARERFTFEEMLILQLLWQRVRQTIKEKRAPQIPLNIETIKQFLATLPFQLTPSQKKAVWDIVRDLAKGEPMNRLLEGDVGSGKTAVAAVSSLGVFNTGKQVALMTPTEILARQHFDTFSRLLSHLETPVALLTGKSALFAEGQIAGEMSKDYVKEMIKQGKVKAVIGTTSLIQKEVKFHDLGLVVVDEQHRFGIHQRSALVRRSHADPSAPQAPQISRRTLRSASDQRYSQDQRLSASSQHRSASLPHFLSLTATPIPRTLALTLFGDLDLSLLEEMPKGERQVSTRIIPQNQKEEAYELIRKIVGGEKRAFVICPRIEERDAAEISEQSLAGLFGDELGEKKEKRLIQKRRWSEAKAVEAEYKMLSEKIFPDLKVGKLHGRLKPEEKDRIIQKFKSGEIQILVTTSVIEVGVDIPEATVMLVEGAEYFGLAQLHQLRGRIGRAGDEAYFLLSMTRDESGGRKRLEALEKINSGFELAEIDLKLRGPGEFLGRRQWGQADLGMITLIDTRLIHRARNIAQELMTRDKTLSRWPELKKVVEARFVALHRE